jgi:hypothetical protein
VYDYLGNQGGQLRLDDDNLASGQTILVTAPLAQGGTVLNITALQAPLIAGTVLEFAGGGMAAVVEAQLAQTAKLGDTSLTLLPIPAPVNQSATATDNGVNLAFAQRLAKACQYGTSQVKFYCLTRYEDADLFSNAQERGSVNRWATSLAARWLCRRRGQSAPQGVQDDADESLEEMKAVRSSQGMIEDIPLRTSGWPFMSNVTIDVGYYTTKVRVEQQISEMTPVQYPQYIDWNSVLFLEW